MPISKDVEPGRKTEAETEVFTESVGKLKKEFYLLKEAFDDRTKTISPKELLGTVTTMARVLREAYSEAAKTPTLEDDEMVSKLQAKLTKLYADKITAFAAGAADDDRKTALKSFVEARLRLARTTTSPVMHEGVRRAATQALSELSRGTGTLEDIDKGLVKGLFDRASDEATDSGALTPAEPLIKDFDSHNLTPALTEIQKSVRKFGAREATVTAWMADLNSYADKLSEHGDEGRTVLTSGQEERLQRIAKEIDTAFLPGYESDGNTDGLIESQRLQRVVLELLHEQRVVRLGGDFDGNVKRTFLRPSIARSEIGANMEGLIEMIVGGEEQNMNRAEVLGLQLEATPETQRKTRLSEEQKKFLQTFYRRLSGDFEREAVQMYYSMNMDANSNDPTIVSNRKYRSDFITYTQKYLNWLNLLMEESGTVVPSLKKVADAAPTTGDGKGGDDDGGATEASADDEFSEENVLANVREMISQAAKMPSKISGAAFQGQDLPVVDMFKKYNKFIQHHFEATDKKNSSMQQAIRKIVELYNFSFDIQEPNQGWVQQKIFDTRVSIEWSVFGGSITAFRSFLEELLPAAALEYGKDGSGKDKLLDIPLMADMRGAAIAIIHDKGNNIFTDNLATNYGRLKDMVFEGYKLVHALDADGEPVKDRNTNQIIWDNKFGMKEIYSDVPEYALDMLWELLKMDLPDMAYLKKRSEGGSLGFGNSNDAGGSFTLDGMKMTCMTDCYNPLTAAVYELSNRVFTGKSFAMHILTYSDKSTQGGGSEFRLRGLREAHHVYDAYANANFDRSQLKELIGQLELHLTEMQFPSLTESIQKGYIDQVQDYYTALSGFLYMYNELWADFSNLSEDDVKLKFTNWMSSGVGKYKLIRGGFDDEFVKITTRIYEARLITLCHEATPDKLSHVPQNIVIELALNLWKATTAKELITEDKYKLKLDLIIDMLDYRKRKGFDRPEKRKELQNMMMNGTEKEVAQYLAKFGVANHLLPYKLTQEKIEYLDILWEEAHRIPSVWEGLKQSLKDFKTTWGLRKETKVPVPYLEPKKEVTEKK